MAANTEVGKYYRIYVKLADSKRYLPLGGGALQKNLIYADIYSPRTQEECQRLGDIAMHIAIDNNAQTELREVKNR